MPANLSFSAAWLWLALKSSDQENKAKPVLAIWPKTGPTDCAAKLHFLTDDASLFFYLSYHAGMHILIRLHLAA